MPQSDPDSVAREALRLIGSDPENWVPDRDGIDHIAGALAQFFAVLLPPAVSEDLLRLWQAHGLEHDWPIDAVEFEYVFADDVDVRRP